MQEINVFKNNLTLCILIISFIAGCSEPKKTTVKFIPTFNNHGVGCESSQHTKNTWSVEQFWFYVDELHAAKNGEWENVKLAVNQWQQDDVALIGIHCRDSNASNLTLEFLAPSDDITSLKFTIGLPMNLNHQNPLTASGIFDNANMFWTWQQGYKGLRLDLVGNEGDGWAYHIGAVGCHSPSSLRPPTKSCRQTNRVEVVIDNFQKGLPITIDVDRIIHGIDIGQQSRCLSMPTQKSCSALMVNMMNKRVPVMYQQDLSHD